MGHHSGKDVFGHTTRRFPHLTQLVAHTRIFVRPEVKGTGHLHMAGYDWHIGQENGKFFAPGA